MPNQSRGWEGRSGSIQGRRGRGRAARGNTNCALLAAGQPALLRDQSPDAGQSSHGRRIVRPRSANLQTRRTHRRQTNGDVSPSKRRPRVAISGGQLYVGRTRLNPKILEHLLMALRPVMLLRNIIDQILMERWKERQPIMRANHDCDCYYALYHRRERYCGEPAKAFQTLRPVCIHYDKGLSNAKWYAAFMQHAYDENEAVTKEGYAVSGDSFDSNVSSSSTVERTERNVKKPTMGAACQAGQLTICLTKTHPAIREMDSKN